MTRLAWAGFLGAVVFGFGYLRLVDPVASRTVDSYILLGVGAAGTLLGVWLAIQVERRHRNRRTAVASQEPESQPAGAMARG